MGTYTPNYNLLKAGNGTGVDPTDDYVDVVSQVDRNFLIIDDVAKKAVNYTFFQNTEEFNLPKTGFRSGDKVFSTWDMSAKVFTDGGEWSNTAAAAPVWTNVPLNSGYELNPSTYAPAYYVEGTTVRLRGELVKTSFAVWVRGTAYAVFPAGSFPSPPTAKEIFIFGSKTSGRVPEYYFLTIATNGSGTIACYSSGAQTAGQNVNYVSLQGGDYDLS